MTCARESWVSPQPGFPWCSCNTRCENTPTCHERVEIAARSVPALPWPETPEYVTLTQVPDGADAWSVRCECGESALGGSRWVRDWLVQHPEHTRDEVARHVVARVLAGG